MDAEAASLHCADHGPRQHAVSSARLRPLSGCVPSHRPGCIPSLAMSPPIPGQWAGVVGGVKRGQGKMVNEQSCRSGPHHQHPCPWPEGSLSLPCVLLPSLHSGDDLASPTAGLDLCVPECPRPLGLPPLLTSLSLFLRNGISVRSRDFPKRPPTRWLQQGRLCWGPHAPGPSSLALESPLHSQRPP